MKRTITHDFSARLLLAVVTFLGWVAQSHAGSVWYAYYAKLQAYPSGAGQVYASDDYTLPPSAITAWSDETEFQTVSQSGIYYAYAKPADGWLLAGFSYATFDDTESPVFNDSIAATGNPASISLTSMITDDPSGETSDSMTVAAMMPLEPNNLSYALFTHVLAEYASGQESLGTLKVTPMCNNIGDRVTLSAIPAPETEHANTKFDHWSLNGKTVSTEPTLTVSVTDTARYIAHFTSDDAETIDFGQGSYRYYYPGDSTDISVPGNIAVLKFFADSLQTPRNAAAGTQMTPFVAGYNLNAGDPVIIYGKGKATLVKTFNASPYPTESLLNRWSGEGVSTDTLDKTHTYYTFDEGHAVLRKTTGTIAPRLVYVALPDSAWNGEMRLNSSYALTTAPDIIYLSNQDAVTNSINHLPTISSAVAHGLYTIDGRRVDAMTRNGIYVFDGRKVVYRIP